MPLVPAHVALLPNGKVLTWVSGRNTYVWDPETKTSIRTLTPKGTGSLMCPGYVHLADGRIFLAGGQGAAGGTQGLSSTLIFDWNTNKWIKGPRLSARRWYPSLTMLGNGEVLILGGGPKVPQVLRTDGTLRSLTTAPLVLRKRYPFINTMSTGDVGFFGHDPTLRTLDTSGNGSWTSFGQRDAIERVYGTFAMFDIDKVLVAGGGPSGQFPTASAVVVEMVDGALVSTPTDPLHTARRQGHLTILADGTVLFSGGQNSKSESVDLSKRVTTPELWDPATGQWTELAVPQITRQYHSVALLLPDGRVFNAGGGYCAKCSRPKYHETSAEIFSPPYLFDENGQLAPRPVVEVWPATALPGGTYSVQVSSATGVAKVGLVKLGADTHSIDQGQRYVPLTLAQTGADTYDVTLPPQAGAVPPGYYMLFAVDGNGVPSVAKMVQVQVL